MFIASINRDATCQNRQIDAYVQGRCRFTGNLFSLITFCCLHEGLGPCIPFEHAKEQSGPKVIKLFMLNSTEHEISTAHLKIIYQQMKLFIALSLSGVVFIMLINVKMPTIVGILTFMSMINFIKKS